jgi:4-diphosphocytidyl-2-C-methyl-D-erythritol kinase
MSPGRAATSRTRAHVPRRAPSSPTSEASAELRIDAPAKINLTLEVVGRMPNGYHAIRSVMLLLPRLADTIRIRVDDGREAIRIRTNSAATPADATNLCHVAAQRYLAHTAQAAALVIDIDKKIPVAAGLGGGSSDAAAVLLALNRRFGAPVAPRELAAIGSDIGKDVPFFLRETAAARATGMGEVVTPVRVPRAPRVLVVNPGIAVPTGAAYAALARELWFMSSRARIDRSRMMERALRSGDMAGVAGAVFNDFEPVVERMHPVIKELKQALVAFGARAAAMSGSGSTVFGLFTSVRSLAVAHAALQAHYPSFAIARA